MTMIMSLFDHIYLLIYLKDIGNDIRLVWSNCMLYNRDGSEVITLNIKQKQMF
jgi:hypothetical protein